METTETETVYVKCGACGKLANQKSLASYTDTVAFEEDDYYQEEDYIWHLSRCSFCNRINLAVENDGDISVYYPKEKELAGLPEEIAKAYKAASAVKNIDANAFAVLIGRLLDLVCSDRKAVGGTLNERLQNLADKGDIPGQLAQMAHQLRHLRNIGAHADLGELTTAEVPIVDDLCRSILEYVYGAPSRIAHVEQRIQKLKSSKA